MCHLPTLPVPKNCWEPPKYELVSRKAWERHHEEGHGGASVDGAILDVGLVGQVVCRLDGDLHPLDGEERRQVGRVGRDDDEGEGPPERNREGEQR